MANVGWSGVWASGTGAYALGIGLLLVVAIFVLVLGLVAAVLTPFVGWAIGRVARELAPGRLQGRGRWVSGAVVSLVLALPVAVLALLAALTALGLAFS